MYKETIISIMPRPMKELFIKLGDSYYERLQEIRLRIGQPLLLVIKGEEYGLGEEGICTTLRSYRVGAEDLTSVLKCISGFSLYALEEELKQGFITLEGGHRVGLVGKAVLENNTLKTLKYISGMNIRIAHEVIGCSQKVMPYILGRDKVYHTLIISPPQCGKTTLLRDMIRNLSDGFSGYGPYTVGVVDERSEIAACYQGVPQNNVGKRTDVLDGCPKAIGMRMLLRSMSPDIVAVDEIGKAEDCTALLEMLSAGITIIATVHGKDLSDCEKRPILKELLQEGLFERIIILSSRQGPCTIEKILEGNNGLNLLR